MPRYIGGRLLSIAPVLFGVSIVVFSLVRLIPGNPAIAILGSRATPALIALVRDQLGLNLPIWRQYLNYLAHALRGDFGISFFYQARVWDVTIERIPITLELIAYAALIALVLAFPLATIAAVRRGTAVDSAIRLFFTAAIGVPSFWLGIVLALLLGVRLHIFPVGGAGSGGLDTLWHLTLPSLTIALHISPSLVRALRSSLIEVMNSNYIVTGRAKGLPPRILLVSHMLRNSLTSLITILAINVGWLIGGTIIIEQVFGVPGLGSLLITSITTRDYTIIQLVTLILALFVIVVNLLTDLAYAYLDPRVTLQ